MPYIKKDLRLKFEHALDSIARADINDAGELNYLVTMIFRLYCAMHGDCYQTFNDVLGAMEGSKLEFYRRYISDYEDEKINNNGDL